MIGPLVSTEWLATHLGAADLRVFDVTVFLYPNPEGRGYRVESGRERFGEGHIPGAVFLDLIEELSAPGTGLPFMMPPPEIAAGSSERQASEPTAAWLPTAPAR